jgi:hypothetical protein
MTAGGVVTGLCSLVETDLNCKNIKKSCGGFFMEKTECTNEKIAYTFFFAFSVVMIIMSFFAGPIAELFPGFIRILTSSQVLTTDACAVGGLGGALLNCGLLGLIAWALMRLSRAKPGGASVGAFFLTVGFSFFGKNCLNVWPIILGVWLFSRIKKEPFGNYVNMSLFACSLAPIISEAVFNRNLEYPLPIGILIAILAGIIIGMVFPPVTAHAATMHKGHNLFNAGLSAGFLAFLFFAIYKTLVLKPMGIEGEYALNAILSDGFPVFFPVLFGCIFAAAVLAGFILNGKSFTGYKELLCRTGHGNDFTALDGMGRVLINFGILGLVCLGYFVIVGAPFTGPTIGSLLCIVCWAGNGSHPRNVVPVIIGYVLVSFVAAWDLNTQAIVVGLCFATGLSPISGRWGWQWGIVAGALHSCLVSYTASIHGGFNIYNGGFTAGLTALILVPVLEKFFREVSVKKASKVSVAGLKPGVN